MKKKKTIETGKCDVTRDWIYNLTVDGRQALRAA